jgi:hypothetical protein
VEVEWLSAHALNFAIHSSAVSDSRRAANYVSDQSGLNRLSQDLLLLRLWRDGNNRLFPHWSQVFGVVSRMKYFRGAGHH